MPGVPATLAAPLDLHLHTRRSDGDESPAEVARRCAAAGLRAAAVTDHNTLSGAAEFAAAAGPPLTAVPGCEITTRWRGAETHCLAYFVDPGDPLLRRRLHRVHEADLEWWQTWADRVARLGVPLTRDDVARRIGRDRVAYPGDYLALLLGAARGDPRFARYGPTAYDRVAADWCRPGQPLHVPEPWMPDLPDVLAWIADAGGVAVLAHPARALAAAGPRECRELLEPLADAGLSGLEAWTSWHTPGESARLAGVCRALGLVATAGSDYHGTRVKPWVPGPGMLPALPPDPAAVLDALHERRPTPPTSKAEL